jgi:mannose-1-phosphate guanylyltransferase
MNTAKYPTERTAIVLASGDSSNLSGLVRSLTGRNVPAQFCSLLGDGTLLESTRRRVAMAIPPAKTLFVVNQAHEEHYQPLLRDLPKSNLVVEPENKGSAAAVLLALLRMAAVSPDASVAIFPSDHFLSDDRDFMRHVEIAFDAVEQRPEFTVLLAMEPSSPGMDYGWIEPAQGIGFGKYQLYRVAGLWERPDSEQAARLLKRGALWNSAVTVGRLSTIVGMIMLTVPQIYAAFAPLRARLPQAPGPRAVANVYKNVPSMGFSQHVLGGATVNLAALAVPRVRWADLSEAQRVQHTWNQLGLKPLWSIGP